MIKNKEPDEEEKNYDSEFKSFINTIKNISIVYFLLVDLWLYYASVYTK